MTSSFVAPQYLLPYPLAVSDYRSVVNAAGTGAIFERSIVANGKASDAQLYSLTLTGNSDCTVTAGTPQIFLTGSGAPPSSTRPDWSWQAAGPSAGMVGFTWGVSQVFSVGTVPETGGDSAVLLSGTQGMYYPTWMPSGDIAAMSTQIGKPRPNTTMISIDGTVLATDLAGPNWWAGMPSVNPMNGDQIVFAGQTVSTGGHYDEDFNYIWLLDQSASMTTCTPLESGCPSSGKFNRNFQGRAPWWSPDGNWVVFESNRASPTGLYSIYLYEVGGTAGAIQLTDPVYNMNHAKWFPFGFPGYSSGCPTLIVAAYQTQSGGTIAWPYGLATLDLSSYVSST